MFRDYQDIHGLEMICPKEKEIFDPIEALFNESFQHKAFVVPNETATLEPTTLPTTRRDFTKRKRRKFDQMERIYDCDYLGCLKSYETISHLNTHRQLKNHGHSLSIDDFE